MNITTNNVPRWLVEHYELTEKERAEFDYLDWLTLDSAEGSRSFFRYKGQLCDLGEFMRCEHEMKDAGWDAYQADSYFSGLVIKLLGDGDRVIVGRYCT